MISDSVAPFGRPIISRIFPPLLSLRSVGAFRRDFFSALACTERDDRAVIVSESMARKFWPKQSPLGQRIYFGDEKSPRYEIVGIVGDVLISLDDTPQPTMYRTAFQGLDNTEYAVVDAPGDTKLIRSGTLDECLSLQPE
jgi:hypothetical protein